MKANQKIVALLISALLLVVAGAAVSFWTFKQIDVSSRARTQTADVLKRTNGLLSSMKDAETGQRGYLLTGDETFLEPYLAVRDGVNGQLEELRQLTADSGAVSQHLDALVPLIDAKMAQLSQTIELRRNGDMTSVQETVSSRDGKRLMDSIRAEIGSINQIEESDDSEGEWTTKHCSIGNNCSYIPLSLF